MDEKITGMPDGLPSPYRRDEYEHPFWLAGYKAGREQGMREAARILKLRDELAFQNIKDFAEQEKVSFDENDYLLGRGDEANGAYRAILAAIGEKHD